MKLPHARLESWMRDYYFSVDADIGSSGVENYSMREVRELLEISVDDLDRIMFHDSQTLGGANVRQAIADHWTDGDPNRVMVTHGSTEANFMIMTTLIEPGDEVVVLDPFYQQLYAIAEARGCHLKRWELRYENAFRPRMDELRQLVSQKTRMIVVNFPHNPTGATLTIDELDELVDIARRVGAYLVWDAAFEELTYDAPPLPDPVSMYDRVLSMGTLSKAYGLPGLRVGWCLGSSDVLEKFIRLRDYTILHLSPLVEFLTQKVMEHKNRLVQPRLEQARRHRELLDRWITEHSDDIEWALPAGGVTGFVRFRADIDVEEFCHALAREHRVLLVPGSCFKQPQHARLGFGCSHDELTTGLDAVGALLQKTACVEQKI